MTMDRAELMQLINSGRSLAFNCHDIGSRISPDDGNGKLFSNTALNNSLFFKTMTRNTSGPTAVSEMRGGVDCWSGKNDVGRQYPRNEF